jgi:CheY-like chemotaxis protein
LLILGDGLIAHGAIPGDRPTGGGGWELTGQPVAERGTDRTAGDTTGVDGRVGCDSGVCAPVGEVRYSLCRILVVDDEPDLRFLLRKIFEKAGHEVADAGHGAQALECVRGSRPELVVTDLMMPVMDGHELICRLRADPATAQIPILAVTGAGELTSAADALLAKPYRPKQILAAANALLASQVDRI